MERRCRCHLLDFTLSLFFSSFPHLTQSLIASSISVWPLLFFCGQGLHSDNFHSHTHASVWFSSAQFGSVQAASGTSFMYNDQRGSNHTCKSARLCECVCMCVYECVCIPDRPTDPEDCCPPGLPAFQADIQYSMCDRCVRMLKAASVRR